MNKEYKIKLDLNKKLYNKKMAFNQFDENVNDFYIEVTKNNEIVKDLDKAIVVLAVIKPNKEVDSQFVEVENGVVYANLKPSMKDEIGIYTARAMLILESEKVVTDVISYEVKEDKIFSLLNDTVETTEEFTLLTDMLSRLSTIELNENNREETFNNIKDEFEIIKNNHNELVTTETDNKVTELLGPVVSKANEKINEVDNKIVDIENAISEADSKINNAIAKIPPKSELIGEKGDKGEKGEKGDKGDRGEQGLQGIQGIQGIQGERGLQGVKGDKGDKGEQGIQGLKGDKGDKGDRGEQGVKGDTPSITHLETSINNKIQEVETRFNTLISAQQQDAEVIDARDGETSLKARLDRDIEKAKQVYVNVEGSHISTDSSVGYLKDVEILGNTIQSASNLADIRSVGDKVEGQELYEIPVLSRGKNLLSCGFECGDISFTTGLPNTNVDTLIRTKDYIKVEPNQNIKFSNIGLYSNAWFFAYDYNKNFICIIENVNNFITPNNCKYIKFRTRKANSTTIDLVDIPSYKIQIEEGTVATPYEPYVEDKLTILSPTPLEKVGDVADRIIEKNGVWGIEKNTIRKSLTASSVAHNGTVNGLTEYIIDTLENSDTTITSNVICNKLVNKFSTTEEGCFVTKNQFRVRVLTNTYPNAESIKNEVINNKWYIIYKSAQPQFIPLPHDQQVKLRAFANKTNISFLTETEGTIKAQVPKSLGATVNTHTTQISNLNKELDRVKKLEESTVSTVTTESDFTTVEATSNGYFEDVKLEGKTLVNLANKLSGHWVNSAKTAGTIDLVTIQNLSPDKYYTLYAFGNSFDGQLKNNQDSTPISDGHKGNTPVLFKGIEDCNFKYYVTGASELTVEYLTDIKIIILEGDHTQNPPSYFEGLKSVGQGTDEIVVSSVKGDGNLCEGNELNISIKNGVSGTFSKDIAFRPTSDSVAYFVDCEGSQLNNKNVAFRLLDKNKNILGTPNFTTTDIPNYNFKFSDRGIKYSDVYYLKVYSNNNVGKD